MARYLVVREEDDGVAFLLFWSFIIISFFMSLFWLFDQLRIFWDYLQTWQVFTLPFNHYFSLVGLYGLLIILLVFALFGIYAFFSLCRGKVLSCLKLLAYISIIWTIALIFYFFKYKQVSSFFTYEYLFESGIFLSILSYISVFLAVATFISLTSNVLNGIWKSIFKVNANINKEAYSGIFILSLMISLVFFALWGLFLLGGYIYLRM